MSEKESGGVSISTRSVLGLVPSVRPKTVLVTIAPFIAKIANCFRGKKGFLVDEEKSTVKITVYDIPADWTYVVMMCTLDEIIVYQSTLDVLPAETRGLNARFEIISILNDLGFLEQLRKAGLKI